MDGLLSLSLSTGDKNGLGPEEIPVMDFPWVDRANGSLDPDPEAERPPGVFLPGVPELNPWTDLDLLGVVRLEAKISRHCARVD